MHKAGVPDHQTADINGQEAVALDEIRKVKNKYTAGEYQDGI